jgi:hypothetical protein
MERWQELITALNPRTQFLPPLAPSHPGTLKHLCTLAP